MFKKEKDYVSRAYDKRSRRKLNTDGYNMLSQRKNKPLKIFIGQFRDIMKLNPADSNCNFGVAWRGL